jgi:hypothetical protein
VSQLPNVMVPLTHPDTGRITREWLLPLQAITTAATTDDLTALQATLTSVQLALVTANAQLVALTASVAALDGITTSLQAAITALQLRPNPFTFVPQQEDFGQEWIPLKGDKGEPGTPGYMSFVYVEEASEQHFGLGGY